MSHCIVDSEESLDLLVLTKARVYHGFYGAAKSKSAISFPLRLRLPQAPNDELSDDYVLVSAIAHVGTAYEVGACYHLVHRANKAVQGHFVTYRRTFIDGSLTNAWVCASDATIKSCRLEAVMASNPYMLFYLREPL